MSNTMNNLIIIIYYKLITILIMMRIIITRRISITTKNYEPTHLIDIYNFQSFSVKVSIKKFP